jgi:hypothetical protein
MRKFNRKFFLGCGLFLTLAAFPVFAQEEKSVGEYEMTQRPLDNLAQLVRRETAAGKVDLTKPFSIQLEGVLNNDGRLDASKSKFTKSAGDAAMIEIGKSFIKAVSESGFLSYVKDFGVEKLNLVLVQNDNQIYADVFAEVETPQRAASISKSLNSAAQIARTRKDERKSLRDDEKILISGLKAITDGKTLGIKVAYEKSVIQELINRILK